VENSSASGNVNGNSSVGGLIGNNSRAVSNSHATGDVEGSGDSGGGLGGDNRGAVQNNSRAEGDVKGSGNNVGGLAGYNSGTVSNSHATGDVEGSGDSVGGLVGYNFAGTTGTMQNNYATGDVKGRNYVGGLVGRNEGRIVHASYATGDVEGNGIVGGLVGWNDNGTAQNSYATGDVNGRTIRVGGLVGANDGTVQNSYATGNVKGGDMVGGLVGDHWSNAVQHCVALNPSVIGTDADTYAGRVVGRTTSGTMTNNHARSGMNVSIGGTTKTIENDGDSAGVDGQSASAGLYNAPGFWRDGIPLSWDFNSGWSWNASTSLPILQNVGGVQNHTLKQP
jgi:hypothetical protein